MNQAIAGGGGRARRRGAGDRHGSTFTPDGEYTDSIRIGGEDSIVRESDGIHLNEDGAALAAEIVLEAIDRDFSR